MFSLSNWFMPTLAIFSLLLSVFIALHLDLLRLLAFCPLLVRHHLSPLDSPFSKNSFSSSSYSCLPALRMGQKHRHAGRCFKAAVMGPCWDDWADGDCFLAFSSLHHSTFSFFLKTSSPTHTVRELIYSTSGSSPDLHCGMCLESQSEKYRNKTETTNLLSEMEQYRIYS